MFRIAVVNPLRVEVVMPASLYPAVRKGTPMRITPDFPGTQPRIATVALVDKLIEGASNTFRVRLSLPNPGNQLPAGLRCKAELPGSEAPAAPRPVSRSNAPPQLQPQLTPSLRVTPRL